MSMPGAKPTIRRERHLGSPTCHLIVLHDEQRSTIYRAHRAVNLYDQAR